MNRLSVRVVLSHVLVALAGGAVTFLVVRLATPAFFDRGVMGMDGAGMMGRGQGRLQEVVSSSVTTGLIVGIGAALAVAIAASLVMTRRLLRPVQEVRTATRRIAAGDYGHHVQLPPEEELAGLAGDVNSMADRLEETETRRVRLLSEVAHEMRTPLTVLEGTVEGLVDGVFDPTPETLRSLAGEVARLGRLADDLGSLSRVEEHRLELVTEPLDLTALVDSAVHRAAGRMRSAAVETDTEHTASPLVVEGDEQRLGQVLDNLIANAIRAMPDGGHLTLTTTMDRARAVVTVADTGVGLETSDLDRVFERFYRVPGGPTGTRADSGSGIGLTVSRGIAEAHGGSLTARSEGPGRGATFVLTLPRALSSGLSGQSLTSQAGPRP